MSPLWRFVRKLFGKPKGRHAVGVASEPAPVPAIPETAPLVEPALVVEPAPEPEPEPVWLPADEPTPVVAAAHAEPTPVVAAAHAEPTPVVAAAPAAAPIADLGPVRLIFSDGTIAPLTAGSPEERRARYLAQRVIEATAPRQAARNGQNSL